MQRIYKSKRNTKYGNNSTRKTSFNKRCLLQKDFFGRRDGAEHSEFNTFKGWMEKGQIVKKGSKAFFIWSKPRKVQKKQAEQGEKDEFKMYGIAHLFSNAQVEPLTPKQ